jgi:K+-transporting ATPase ATPase B chain
MTLFSIPPAKLRMSSLGRCRHRSTPRKLQRRAVRSPVMFVVYVGSILTTLLAAQALGGRARRRPASSRHRRVAVVHRAVRQRRSAGRGPQQGAGGLAAQPEADVMAKKLATPKHGTWLPRRRCCARAMVLVEAGDVIPPTAK